MSTDNHIAKYLEKVNRHYQSGHASEHTYRVDFANLIEHLMPDPDLKATNEPNNVTNCGNPDYVITRKKIPVGFIEAKDIGKDLDSKQYKEQFGRYRKALDNLIITDYLLFRFYQHGEKVHEIRIAEVDGKKIKPLPENFEHFVDLVNDFCTFIAQTIKSPKTLAEMMAAKARLLETILESAITSDEENEKNSDLKQQYETFKKILIHDLTPQGFADIYAQTLAYGMFAARLHDTTPDSFSRQEAAELIPKSNPFLRKLFSHVAGVDIDKRIATTVDNLAEVFRATNVAELLKGFGQATQTQDPIIHFYETFLAAYDPKLRKARGVWYTPEPVVNFIVRSVDEILKTEFGLADGLADTCKTKIDVQAQGTAVTKGRAKGKPLTETKEVHKVQVLDPATGTGTFLAEVIRFIYDKKFKAMQGAWSSYVEEHLIPRLNGFELLMASYSMAHLKLDLLLTETDYQSKENPRFKIFLTNSLEEHHADTNTLFSTWLSTEANEANNVKRDTPVMVVMGNPPYSGESANKSAWIMELMEDYKKEPGGKEKLKERNPKWINDDYVKFLRYGQHFIEKNGEGILAYINPHGFLDNPTFRGMRWNLLKAYDKIYTIDLHGNSKKKETAPDGGKDENVFDIQQGVSINFFIKTSKKKTNQPGQVFHHDLYGKREDKYRYLSDNRLGTVPFKPLPNNAPMYFMMPKDFELEKRYNQGFAITEAFPLTSVGIVTSRDAFIVTDDHVTLKNRLNDFYQLTKLEIQAKYTLKENKRWNIETVKNATKKINEDNIKPINYRPFDAKFVYYDNAFIERPRKQVMQHFLSDENVGLIIGRQGQVVGNMPWNLAFITKSITDFNLYYRGGGNVFPLYIYPESNGKKTKSLLDDAQKVAARMPNLDPDIIARFEKHLGLRFAPEEQHAENDTFTPIDVLDYCYGVLHSPTYRAKYKEFLKIDFPKIPYPKTQQTFSHLVNCGGKLRQLHLLEAETVTNFITQYPKDGSNEITTKIATKDWELYDTENRLGRIWINEQQYFDNIPLNAWEFYIGGYQPAQKWLKDRKGKTLSFNDISHYQKIIVALNETDLIMQEIDKIDFE